VDLNPICGVILDGVWQWGFETLQNIFKNTAV